MGKVLSQIVSLDESHNFGVKFFHNFAFFGATSKIMHPTMCKLHSDNDATWTRMNHDVIILPNNFVLSSINLERGALITPNTF